MRRTLIVVIGLVALVAYLTPPVRELVRPLPPPAAREFVPFDAPSSQYARPVLGTPFSTDFLPSAWLGRLARALAVGSLEQRLEVLAACLAACAVALCAAIVLALGGGPLAAAAAALGFGAGSRFWIDVVSTQRHPVYEPLLFGALLAALVAPQRSTDAGPGDRRHPTPYLSIVLFGLAVLEYPATWLLAPALLAFAGRLRPFDRSVPAVAAAIVMALFVRIQTAQAVWDAAPVTVLLGGVASFAWTDALGWSLGGSARDLVANVAGAVGSWPREYGLLGLALLAAGLVRLGASRAVAARWCLVIALAATVGAALAAGAQIQDAMLPAQIFLWPVAGIGLEWVARMPIRRSMWLAAALGALLLITAVTAGGAAMRATDAVRDYRRRVALTLEKLPVRSAFVAEDSDRDRELARVLSRSVPPRRGVFAEAGRDAAIRVPQDRATIARLRERGFDVFAQPAARRHLEAFGVRFEPLRTTGPALPEYLDLVPRGAIVAIAGGPGLSYVLLPPRGAPTFAAIGGRAQLFGRTSSPYAIVGIKGASEGAIEEVKGDGVDLRVDAGQEIGQTDELSPVILRAVASANGSRIVVNGETLADAPDGLALVVLSPDGDLLTARTLRSNSRPELPLDAGLVPFARLTTIEPCTTLAEAAWTDVSSLAAASAAGIVAAQTERDSRVLLYFSSRYPLDPGVEYLDPRQDSPPTVTSYPAGAGTARRDVLARDGVPSSWYSDRDDLGRIEVRTRRSGPLLAAVNFGGVPRRAFARWQPGLRASASAGRVRDGASSSIELCPGSLAGHRLFDGELQREDLPLDDRELFGSGWHGLERILPKAFRWSTRQDAVVLVPLARAGAVRLSIEAWPAAVATETGPRLTPIVNGTALPGQVMQARPRDYSWSVPAALWKVGANEVILSISRVVNPAAEGIGDDTRTLGVAVSRVRLERLD